MYTAKPEQTEHAQKYTGAILIALFFQISHFFLVFTSQCLRQKKTFEFRKLQVEV